MTIAMNRDRFNTDDCLLLSGLDGGHPLGFLAALGVLQTTSMASNDFTITMSWKMFAGKWRPVLHLFNKPSRSGLAYMIASHLGCPFAPLRASDRNRIIRQKAFDLARTKLKKTEDKLRERGVRGEEREVVEKTEIDPLKQQVSVTRTAWLSVLKEAVPSPEMALGKHLNATAEEFRETCLRELGDASKVSREAVDLLSSFGTDVCVDAKSGQIVPTPFCFITGSGHQYFLDTVRQLAEKVDKHRIEEALFESGENRDEKLSMRWDPIEDRRYALMWEDPTAVGNKATTHWAANLLGYRGLQLIPSVPGVSGLATTGWDNEEDRNWTWPIWKDPITVDVIRSLLSHPLLTDTRIDRSLLHGIGIVAMYRASRIRVGKPPLYKINFTPARRIA